MSLSCYAYCCMCTKAVFDAFPVFSSIVYVNKCLYNRKIMIIFELQKLVLYISIVECGLSVC